VSRRDKGPSHEEKVANFSHALASSRYLVLIPITGLMLASAMLFIFGGFNLLKLILHTTLGYFGLIAVRPTELPIYVEIVEYVHTFLIGTVLYITSVGFFQLFIKKVEFPRWLRVNNTEELETNLIGVTVVVLAINFMSLSFNKDGDYLVRYGIGIALPIAALGLFLGMRAWARKLERETEQEEQVFEAKQKAFRLSAKETGHEEEDA
jgi:uncharacterized membrane protein YqhA